MLRARRRATLVICRSATSENRAAELRTEMRRSRRRHAMISAAAGKTDDQTLVPIRCRSEDAAISIVPLRNARTVPSAHSDRPLIVARADDSGECLAIKGAAVAHTWQDTEDTFPDAAARQGPPATVAPLPVAMWCSRDARRGAFAARGAACVRGLALGCVAAWRLPVLNHSTKERIQQSRDRRVI